MNRAPEWSTVVPVPKELYNITKDITPEEWKRILSEKPLGPWDEYNEDEGEE